jgi:hypothetical protein
LTCFLQRIQKRFSVTTTHLDDAVIAYSINCQPYTICMIYTMAFTTGDFCIVISFACMA